MLTGHPERRRAMDVLVTNKCWQIYLQIAI